MGIPGALAALGSSITWAFASVRYSQVSGRVGSTRVNLARATIVGPFYLVLCGLLHGRAMVDGVLSAKAAWLALSVFCSYGLADSLFFSASRQVGVSTALSIASTYPLWAVLVGVAFRGESFGLGRGLGTILCIGGVATLVRLAPRQADPDQPRPLMGLALAGVTSLMWAGNSIAVKYGATGLDVAQVNTIRYCFALVVLGTAVRVGGIGRRVTWSDWRLLLPAIVADGVLGSAFFVYGLSHSDLAVGTTLTSLAPLISVPIAIAVGAERWSAARLAAVTVTVTGVIVLMTAA